MYPTQHGNSIENFVAVCNFEWRVRLLKIKLFKFFSWRLQIQTLPVSRAPSSQFRIIGFPLEPAVNRSQTQADAPLNWSDHRVEFSCKSRQRKGLKYIFLFGGAHVYQISPPSFLLFSFIACAKLLFEMNEAITCVLHCTTVNSVPCCSNQRLGHCMSRSCLNVDPRLWRKESQKYRVVKCSHT
jgi:hypothetical protein